MSVMPVERPQQTPLQKHAERAAVGLWIALAIATVARALLHVWHPLSNGDFVPIFLGAGADWLAGRPLYTPGDSLNVFRNSPLVAVAFAPLTFLPQGASDIILRLASFFSFVAGLWALVRMSVAPERFRGAVAWVFLLAFPLAMQALGDVQTTGVVAGLLPLSIAFFCRSRVFAAAILLVLCIHVKAYPIALLLLLGACFPMRLALPVIGALLVTFALPFLFQRWDYVAIQYREWLRYGLNNRQGDEGINIFRDFRTLGALAGLRFSPGAYQLVEAGTGAACAGLVLMLRSRLPLPALLFAIYALATAWMTVFGPATESQTYVLFAPAAAMIVWNTLELAGASRLAAAALCGWGLLAITQVALWFPGGRHTHEWGLHAAGGLLLVAVTIACCLRAPRARVAEEVPV